MVNEDETRTEAATVQATAHTTPDGTSDGPGGLEDLFRQHHERVFRVAHRVTGNADDAADVLQNVFLRLARRELTLDPSRDAGSYLHRAAVNTALDLLRSRRRSRSVPLDEAPPEGGETDLPSPERAPLDRELRRALRQGLARLSEKAAQLFVLRYFEGYDNADIARMTGMTPTAVAVALHRARGRLQQELAPLAGGSR